MARAAGGQGARAAGPLGHDCEARARSTDDARQRARRQGARNLIAYCFSNSCRHQALIDVSSYPGDTELPWFGGKVVCAKCEARGRRTDARPNWKEAPGSFDDWSGRPAMPSGEE